MVVNFEFLSKDPIENVITCMNYKIDKVVYFGYQEIIDRYKKRIEQFLKKHCGVKSVVFHAMSHDNLPSILKTMRREIEQEKSQKNQIYFDITGGESLILVAFGILSKEYQTRIHHFDVDENRIMELEEGAEGAISSDVPTQKVVLDLDKYIALRGGVINYRLHKDMKQIQNEKYAKEVENIWNVAEKYWDYWNPFSNFLRANLIPDDKLVVSTNENAVVRALAQSKTKLKKLAKLNEIVDALAGIGALTKVNRKNGAYGFAFKNDFVKDCLWDGGSILELHTYQLEKKESTDCRVGVHIDWDGMIQFQGADVFNEIDVLSMRGNVPVFMSCKSGNMGSQQSLHALYELETVARRFGGKYAKKVLVTTRPLSAAYMERAEDMGIEVRCEVKN